MQNWNGSFLEQKVETLDISSEIVCLFEETDPVMTRELVNLLLEKRSKDGSCLFWK